MSKVHLASCAFVNFASDCDRLRVNESKWGVIDWINKVSEGVDEPKLEEQGRRIEP